MNATMEQQLDKLVNRSKFNISNSIVKYGIADHLNTTNSTNNIKFSIDGVEYVLRSVIRKYNTLFVSGTNNGFRKTFHIDKVSVRDIIRLGDFFSQQNINAIKEICEKTCNGWVNSDMREQEEYILRTEKTCRDLLGLDDNLFPIQK